MVFFAALLLLLAERSQFYNDAKVVYNLWSFAQCWVIFHIRGGGGKSFSFVNTYLGYP